MSTRTAILFLLGVFAFACGSGEVPRSDAEARSGETAQDGLAAGLTPFELEHGIGPIQKRLELGAIDGEMAARGKETFDMKCAVCHRFDRRLVGPSMGGLTEKRSPEYIVNMILNPDEMIKRHPVAHEQFREYLIPMTFQNVAKEEALEILEYLRMMDRNSR